MRIKVVLPEPLGPRSPKVSPFLIRRSRPSSAHTAPKCLVRASALTKSAGSPSPGVLSCEMLIMAPTSFWLTCQSSRGSQNKKSFYRPGLHAVQDAFNRGLYDDFGTDRRGTGYYKELASKYVARQWTNEAACGGIWIEPLERAFIHLVCQVAGNKGKSPGGTNFGHHICYCGAPGCLT